jgi:acyl-CoA reductase-like NAD-dependent aldehyde dehydrogenase
VQLIEKPGAEETREYKMLIGGEWVDASSGKTFESVNPYTGKAWATAPEAGEEDVDLAVRAAREAFDEGPWGTMTGTERACLMRRLAELIAENAESLAIVESTDNGKLLREMGGQLGALPEWYYYFAGAADKIQGDTIPSHNPDFFVYTRREPIGVVGAIVPWNSPLLLLTWKLAPALAAGCTFVAKTAEQTPASTLEFARLLEEADFPPGVFNVVTGYGTPTGSALVRHPGVDKVAFTGSTETGKQVMKDAADHVAKVTLELGGKSPNIVFEDADIEAAANGVVSGIFAATGRTCMAGSRLVVDERVHDELVEVLSEKAKTIKLSGEGQVVDVALYEAVFNLMKSMVPEYDVAGIVRERTGAALPGITPSNSYRSFVAIGGNSDAIFKRLMQAIGRPDLGEDPRYETNADRTEHAEELDEVIEEWTEQHDSDEVFHILEGADVPVGPIYSVTDIVVDPSTGSAGCSSRPTSKVSGL